MGSRQGHQDGIPPEIAANFKELFPEHEHLEEFLQDQETVYQSLQVVPKHSKDRVPSDYHPNNSCRNQSVDASSISRSESMNSDVDVALTLSMLELDTQIELQNASVSESSQSTAGNRGSRSTDTTAADFDDLDPDNMTYEELQSLGDAIGVESRGLSKKVLSRLPSRKFKGKSSWFSSKAKSQPQECVICSEEYTNGELLTILQCKHRYHKECIGKWFSSHKTCPICKTEIT